IGGAGTVTAATISGATMAAMTATATTASISVINNKGNLGRALEETTSSESLENIAIATAAGGITAGAGSVISNSSAVANTANDLSNNLREAFIQNVTNSVSTAALQSAIKNQDLKDTLKSQTENILISTIGQVAANQIG